MATSKVTCPHKVPWFRDCPWCNFLHPPTHTLYSEMEYEKIRLVKGLIQRGLEQWENLCRVAEIEWAHDIFKRNGL